MAELLFFLQVALSLDTPVSRLVPRARLRIYITILFKFEMMLLFKCLKQMWYVHFIKNIYIYIYIYIYIKHTHIYTDIN